MPVTLAKFLVPPQQTPYLQHIATQRPTDSGQNNSTAEPNELGMRGAVYTPYLQHIATERPTDSGQNNSTAEANELGVRGANGPAEIVVVIGEEGTDKCGNDPAENTRHPVQIIDTASVLDTVGGILGGFWGAFGGILQVIDTASVLDACGRILQIIDTEHGRMWMVAFGSMGAWDNGSIGCFWEHGRIWMVGETMR